MNTAQWFIIGFGLCMIGLILMSNGVHHIGQSLHFLEHIEISVMYGIRYEFSRDLGAISFFVGISFIICSVVEWYCATH